MIPVDEPINRAAQTDPVVSTTILHAYQKAIDVGTPMNMAAAMGRLLHHSETYWELSWNQPRICPNKNNDIPI